MDPGGFAVNPARRIYLVLAFLLNAFAAIRIPEVGKKRGQQKASVQRQHLAVVLLQVLTLSIVAASPFCDRRNIAVLGDRDAVRFLGLGLYAIGFLVMHFAEAYLGKLFSLEVSIQEGHTLVTSGPYRYIRHPRYGGITIFALGIAMLFRSCVGLLLAVMTIGVLVWRIRDEEALMRREFGEEWEKYSSRTWRFIPFIY